MRVGVGLLTNGAAASEVTATVLRVTSSSGFRNVSVQVTFDEVVISYLPDELSTPFTRVRAATGRTQDFSRLAAFEDVTHGYITGEIGLDEARHRAAAIPQTSTIYKPLLATAGFAVMGGGLALSFGAETIVVLAATLASGLLITLADLLGRRQIPAFYSQAVGGLIAVLTAVLVSLIDPTVNSSIVVVACIIVQLTGLASIGAMQDAVTGWYVTAAGRILETLMLTVGVVAGVRGGLLLADIIGVDIAISAAMPVTPILVLVLIVSSAAAGLGYGIGTQVPPRMLLWISLVAAVSGVLANLLSSLVMDRVYAAAAASFMTGAAAVILGDKLRAPTLAFVMGGVIPLVPGSRIYRGLLGLGDDPTTGALELFGAAEVAIGIAAGAVLGQLLASRLVQHTRRNAIAYTPTISSPFTTMRRRRLSLGSHRPLGSRRRGRRGGPQPVEPSTMTGEMTALSPSMFEDSEGLPDLEDPRGQRSDPEESP